MVAGQNDVQISPDKMFQECFIDKLIQIDFDVWVAGRKLPNKRHKEKMLIVTNTDPEFSGISAYCFFGQTDGQVVLLQQFVGLEVEFFSCFRQFYIAGIPLEQLDIQSFFQGLDPTAECGLGNMFFFCRFGETEQFSQNYKTVDVCNIHDRILSTDA